MVGAAVRAGVVDFAALGVDQAGEGRQASDFAAVGDFAWASHNGSGCWVFDEVDGRALFDKKLKRFIHLNGNQPLQTRLEKVSSSAVVTTDV